MPKRGRLGHTVEHRGARVIVTLVDGTSFVDRFIERAKHRRWILLKERGRVPMSEVSNVARIKGELMFIKPTAADFDCFVDGKLLAWDDPRGLDIRWLAANRALSASDRDLDDAAVEITRLARGELQCGNVEVRRREIWSLCDG